ncbi:MAG: aldehyde dehydrogenase family protein, partial [Owenweeksia sp.]
MQFQSVNPYTNKTIDTYEGLTSDNLNQKLEKSWKAFESWRKQPFSQRARLMNKAAEILRKNVDEYALMITREMGKPITEAKGEVKKCAWVCEYYAENAEKFLTTEHIKTDAAQSFVRH